MKHRIDSLFIEHLGQSVFYRDQTSDTFLIQKNLIDHNFEYHFHMADPKVIWDVGANIGVTTIQLALQYPNAMIFAFEPQKDNFELLVKNTSHFKNVKAYHCGLSNETGFVNLYTSESEVNHGGFSVKTTAGVDKSKWEVVELRSVSDFLKAEQGPDLIKIDCEGSEYDVLTSIPRDTLMKVGWIHGELHGEKDFELLKFLEGGFDLAFSKGMSNRVYPFIARNLAIC